MVFRLLRTRSLLLIHTTGRCISTTSFPQSGGGGCPLRTPIARAHPPPKGPSSADLSTTDIPDRLHQLLHRKKVQLLSRTFEAFPLLDSTSIVDKIVRKYPTLLNYDAENTIKPKLEFLYYSSGFQRRDVADIVASNPRILLFDFDKNVIPAIRFLKEFIPAELSCMTVILLKRHLNVSNYLSIIEVLQKHCMSKHAILRILFPNRRHFALHPRKLDRMIRVMKGVGLDENSPMFSYAVNIFCTTKDEMIARKIQLYRSFGWKDEEIFKLICSHPHCIISPADERTKKMVVFYREALHWETSIILKNPFLMNSSIEKRIKSRGAVLNLLMLKGQIRRYTGDSRFRCSNKKFEDRYVERYRNKVVGVVEAYEGGVFEGWEQGCPEKVWVKF